jgi:hypothetical protein
MAVAGDLSVLQIIQAARGIHPAFCRMDHEWLYFVIFTCISFYFYIYFQRKNLRIIHLPNGDRTLADIRDLKNSHLALSPLQRLKLSRMLASHGGLYQDKVMDGVTLS